MKQLSKKKTSNYLKSPKKDNFQDPYYLHLKVFSFVSVMRDFSPLMLHAHTIRPQRHPGPSGLPLRLRQVPLHSAMP